MPNYRFQSVYTRRQASGACPLCGKRVVRARQFEQTVNPFNRNDDGTMRTYDEVRVVLNAEADAWVPDFTHQKCMRPDRSTE